MSKVEWSFKGVELANCNCAYGCPCQFNALPTHGNCRAMTAFRVESGHFGEVKLDGLDFVIMGAWPGAIHQGNGTWMSIIDERADEKQRKALEAITHGEHTDPGGSIFQIFNSMVTKKLPTLYRPIRFEVDRAARSGKVSVPGVLDTSAEPIRNPVTGAVHKVSVTLPEGFEYTQADFVSGHTRTHGDIVLQFTGTHAHIAPIHFSAHGVVR
ncbi:MAG TPA: DUF1326 domain-containing protein [Nevskiaceae bacterium]|nr:DUF1326 domain-containing protein [Nevskiaceae bacterium]